MKITKNYDIAIVGSGLFGGVIAYEAAKLGKSVLVVERRNHIGGNCYTEEIEGINVHKYGAHIFRTSDKEIWDYLHQFCEFNNFVNSPIANYHGELLNMPFNMNTYYQLWGVKTPAQAREKIASQCVPCENPTNLKEHILSLAGKDIFEKLVEGYTEKQWGMTCEELPPSVMRRIPLRFTFDNNYFRDPYQGIPIGGYTQIFTKMFAQADLYTGVDYLRHKEEIDAHANMVIYTGPIDEYYDFCYGELRYRSLRFEHEIFDTDNKQGVAVMNYTDKETPYTRTIEHKHFEFGTQPKTVVSREYSQDWHRGIEPYYPLENADDRKKYQQYQQRAEREEKVKFGGRLAEYRYYGMEDTIRSALSKAKLWL